MSEVQLCDESEWGRERMGAFLEVVAELVLEFLAEALFDRDIRKSILSRKKEKGQQTEGQAKEIY